MPNLVTVLFLFDPGNGVRVSQRFERSSKKDPESEVEKGRAII